MSILTRYLLKQFGLGVLAVASVLMLIYLSNRVAVLLARVAAGELAGDVVFTLLFLKSIDNLSLVIPPAFFIAVLLALGRMYRDQEITVLAACGVGPRQIYRALLLFSLPLTLALAGLVFAVGPWSAALGERLKADAQQRADVSGISAGRFKESRNGEVVFYTEALSADRTRFEGVFLQNQSGERLGVMVAESGHELIDPASGDRYLVLVNGRRYEGEPGRADYRIVEFARYGVRIEDRPPRDAASLTLDARPTLELWRGGGSAEFAQLHARLAVPLSALLLGLLAVPLSRTSPRQGRYGKLFLAILIYVLYANVLVMSENWLARGLIPSAAGMWLVHAAIALLWWALARPPRRARALRRATAGGA